MADPITVPPTATRDLIWQGVRAGIIFGSAVVASQLYRDAVVTGAAMAFATAMVAVIPAIVAYAFGALKTIRNQQDRKIMANIVPDAVAKIEEPK